ncbi:YadA-like family protein [Advenella mimigardefordensis]|uniref:YadA-like domain-containing protein n=1 Tax=Advenella mimigardefordensis (strain DSM 17166 / LMG 22922 / DPN7) TaxID=1247726 RepID=W0PC81_ADVMD|nr:YadA-like family protein [Advenella mimigardefordensis]AHG64326.1 YadA-like domain-containing protein [Advenella mimigardefordensis DPN7]
MNKIFRVIWNAATRNWVVVSEIAKTAVSKPGSIHVTGKQLSNVQAAVVATGRWKLTELATAFYLAGLWMFASPVMAAPLKTSSNPGTEVASNRCGTGATATNVAGIAVGCGAQAASGNIAILERKNPYEKRTDLIKSTITSGGLLEAQSIAIGESASAGKSAIAVGGRSNAVDELATAIGVWARAQGKSSVAIGPRTLATGNTSLAIGRQSVATADFAQAIGNVSAATGVSALAIGHSATALGPRSIAIGGADTGIEAVAGQKGVTYQAESLTKADGIGAIALGGGARAMADRAMALGEWSRATRARSVALGTGSTTDAAATAVSSATVGGTVYSGFAGVVSDSDRVVSVGLSGGERQIKNVGSGEISATSTDAINGSQLYAAMAKQTGGGSINFSGDANGSGSTAADDKKINVPSGDNLNITGGVTTPNSLLTNQIGVVADPSGKNLSVRLRKDLDLSADGSLQLGTTGPKLSAAGLNMNNKKVTGLAAGTADADAVNVSQLNGVKTIANNAATQAGNAATQATNAMTEASKGWNLQANGDTASKVAPGDKVQFLNGTNINVTRNGKDLTIATTPALTADSLTINNGGPILNGNGIAMGNKKITGLANGTAPNDAVNFSQLGAVKTTADNAATQAGNALTQAGNAATQAANAMTEASKGWNLQANGDTASKVAPGDKVQFLNGTNINVTRNGKDLTIATTPALTADSLTINNGGPALNGNGIAMGNKKIAGLADGTAPNDAVNFSQLSAVKTTADNAATQAGNALTQAGNAATQAANAMTEASKGWNLQANGDTASKVAPGDKVQFLDGTNINVTRSGNDLTIATTSALTADSLTINNGGPALNGNGIAMGNKKIAGLADGTAPNDAVNFSQLGAVKTTADNAATQAGNALTQAGNAATQAANAMTEASKGWNLQANGDTASKVAPGDKVQFLDGTNINVTRSGNDLTIATTSALTADSLTINNGGPALNGNGIAMGNKKITGLADGTEAGDAVNFSQLDGVKSVADNAATQAGNAATQAANAMTEASKGWNLQANGDTASKVAPGDKVQFLDGTNINVTRNGNDLTIGTAANLTADSLTINNGGPALNGNGIAMGNKKITGLADGTEAGDAVNFSQLDGVKTVADNAATQAGNAATQAANAMTEASKGWNLQANGDTASKVAPGDKVQFLDGTNINVTRNGNDLTIGTAANLTADSLTINNGGPALNGNGIAMGNKKITGLADGTEAGDAVNFSQLDGVKTTADNAATQAGNAMAEASKGWNLQANGDTASKVAPGDKVQFLDGTNINVTRSGNDLTIATTSALTADSLTINNGGPVLNGNGIAMGNKKITGLADGTEAGDAVNFSQLDGVKTTADNAATQAGNAMAEASKGWNLQANGDTASKVAPGDKVQFLDGTNINVTRSGNDLTIATTPVLTADSLTINNGGPALNGNGIAMGNKKITGLADGTEAGDAVNFSQLDGVKTTADNAATQAANAMAEASKGWNLQANGDTASKVAPGDKVQFLDGTNITVTRSGNDLTIGTAANLTADSLTINNGGPALNGNGIAMGNKKIAGLADGTEAGDAVNFSQLDSVKTTADNALAEAGKGWNLQANGDTATKVAPGDKVQFLDGTNINVTRNGNDLTIATTSALTADSLTINNGGPVLGSTGIDLKDKKLTNVGAGTLAADSKDGVNASQLFAVGNSTASALGGDSAFDPATGVVTPSLKVGEKSFTNVNDALGDLNTTLENTTAEASKGWNLQANGDTASKVAPGDKVQFLDGTNINVTRNGNDLTIATTSALTADSLTINNGGPVLGSTGIDLKDKKLTNVGAGTLAADSKDGVNASQLYAVGNSTASAFGGDSAFDPATGVVTPSLKVGEKNFTNVNDALGDLNTTLAATTEVASKGFNLQANDDTASKVAPGDTVKFIDGTNINVTRNGNDLTIATAPGLTADSLTINNGGPVLSSTGLDMKDKKLTNVGAGTLAADSKDGVNASQLFAVGNSTASALGGDSAFDPATGVVTPSLKVGEKNFSNVNEALGELNTTLANTTAEASKGWNLQANGDTASKVAPGDKVQFLDGTNITVTRSGNDLTIGTAANLTADSLTINNGGPALNGNGIAMGNKKIAGLADGTEAGDAVNFSQLDSVKATADNALAEAGKGWNLQANGDTATKVAPGDKVQFLDGTNINVTRNGNDLTIATTSALTADSLTINNGGPVLGSTGIDLKDKKLTNVGAGTLAADSKDGVNASQLFAVGNSTASALGGDSAFDPATGVVTPSLKVGEKSFTNVNDALGDLNTTLENTTAEASKGWNLQANGDAASKVAPGDKVQFLDGTNINVTRNGNDLTIGTAANLTADTLTINNGGPVLGSTGIDLKDKKLTNVAGGTLAADSKDAVNGSQLFAVGNSTASAFGGDSAFDPATGVVTPSLKVGEKNFTNVNDALGDLNTTLANTTAEANKGWNLQANGDTATKVAPGDKVQFLDGTNINVTRNGNDLTIATAPALTADSLTINNGGPVLSSTGLDLKDKKLTNLTAGTLAADSKDGVNASQLFAVGNSTASAFGGDSAFDPATGVVTPSLKVGEKNFTNVNEALGDLNTTLENTTAEASKGWNLQANGDTASKVAPGDKVQFLDGTNINVTRNGNDLTIATTSALTADSLKINNGGPVLSSTGLDLKDKKLTNVAAGTLAADSKDGVNASQLFAVGNSTASAFGGDSAFDPATGVVTPSLKVGEKNFTNVNDALGDLNTTLAATTEVASKGFNLQANGDTATKVAPGDKVQFLDGTNINVTRNGNDLTFATAANLTADSLTINNGGPVLSSTGLDLKDKKLTNVAAGTLAADSKDAVNGSQLFAVGNSTASAFGGDSAFDPATGVVTPSLKVGEKNFTNVNDALGDLNTTLTATTEVASKGFNLQANGDTATKVAPGDKVQFLDGTNINVTRNGNDLTIATTSALTADSLTINNGGPVLGSTGIDLKDKKLTNVAAGTLAADSKDAVNGSQLFAVGNSTASAFGGDSAFDPATGVVTPSLKVGEKNFTNVNDALGDLNTTLTATTEVASKGFNLQANGDTATKVAPGDKVQFLDGTNINVTRNGNDLTIATTSALTADSLTINNGGPVLGSTGIDLKDKKLTNVAAGTLAADSKDAVNGSQLFAVGNSTASAFGGDSAFDPATGVVTPSLKVGEKNFTNVNDALGDLNTTLTATTEVASKGFNLQANGDTATKVAPGDKVQFLDGTSINVTRNGNDLTIATTSALTADSLTINNGGPVLGSTGIDLKDKKLTNVGAGTLAADSKDGVNAGQLFAVGNSTASAFGGDSAFDPATGVVTPSLKVGEKNFTNVNDALGDLSTTLAATTEVASKGFNLQANGDTATKVAPGDKVQFLDGTNINVTRNGNDLTIGTAANLTADSLTINNGGPVLGSTGIDLKDKKLTNVAAGTLAADSKDAVNGSQLFAVGNSTASAFGGDSAFDPATGVVTPSLKVGEKNFTNVNDALGDLNSTLAATTEVASKGFNLQANGDTASKVAPGDTVKFIDGTNINVTRNGNELTFATTANLTADSLTINNGGPVLSSTGLDLKDKKLTNVAAGTLAADSKDAVNGSQLFAVGNSTASAFGGDSAFDPATGVVTPSLKVGERNFTNVNDALGDLNSTLAATTEVASKGFNLQANGDTASKVAPGDTVKFIDGTNINVTRNGNELTFATTANLTADSLTINNGGPVLSSTGLDLKDKKLTNVAAGTLAADSKDAVNGSQLFAVGNSTASAFGGDSAFDPATGVVTPSLKVGEKNFTNVNDALGDLNSTLAATTEVASKGFNLQANGDTASKVAPGDTVKFIDGTNINVTRNGNELTFATAANLTADSLTINNGGPVLSSTGLDLKDKKLTNLAAGTLSKDSKDAVNASQLFKVGSSTAAAFGGDSTFDPETGEITAALKVGDQRFTSVNGALDAINSNVGAIARRGWDIAGSDGIVANVATGEQVRFVAGNAHTRVGVTEQNGVSTVSVSAASSPLQYTQTNQANGNNAPVADPFGKTNSVTLVGQDASAPVSLNNVAKAKLSADSLQAVNGQQLYGLGESIASTLGGDTRFNAETGKLDSTFHVGNNTYHNVADALSGIGEVADRGWQLQLNNDTPQKVAAGSTVGFNQGRNIELTRDGNQITVATAPNVTFESIRADRMEGDAISAKSYLGVIDGPAMTQSGIDAAGKPITNLKPGEIAEGSTDAVTGGQLHSLAGGTATALNRLQGNLDRVAKDANAGSATAGAMANLPQAYLPGKSMFALATARYVGQQGFAAGLSKVSENGNWIIKGSVSGNTRGKTMVGAGVGYQW